MALDDISSCTLPGTRGKNGWQPCQRLTHLRRRSLTQFAGTNDLNDCLCQNSCCWIIMNKYQTLASGVTSQRYHLRWHTPHSKRFAPSWNILEFSNRPDEKHSLRLIVIFQVNSCVSPRDARTPLHLAAALGNLPITQLLIWVSLDFFVSFKLFCFSLFFFNFCFKWARRLCGNSFLGQC